MRVRTRFANRLAAGLVCCLFLSCLSIPCLPHATASAYNPAELALSQSTISTAQDLLGPRHIATDRQNRIFLPLLSHYFFNLCAFANRTVRYLELAAAPIDIIVFTPHWEKRDEYYKACPMAKEFPLKFMNVSDHWVTPPEASDPNTWAMKSFDDKFRRIGHWRLLFPFHLAKALGYPYLLTLDDDSYLDGPVQVDLLEEARTRGLHMAAHSLYKEDTEHVRGLAELTRYYIVSEQFEPVGPIFKHTDPHTMNGLFSTGTVPKSKVKGWDATLIHGSFVMVSIDFWFQEHVQRFVQLFLQTGSHFRFRWNEQGVMSMVNLVFVEEKRFWLFGEHFKQYVRHHVLG